MGTGRAEASRHLGQKQQLNIQRAPGFEFSTDGNREDLSRVSAAHKQPRLLPLQLFLSLSLLQPP